MGIDFNDNEFTKIVNNFSHYADQGLIGNSINERLQIIQKAIAEKYK